MKTKNIIIAGLIMCLGITIGGAGVYAGTAAINPVYVTVDDNLASYSTTTTELSLDKIDMTSNNNAITFAGKHDYINLGIGSDIINFNADTDTTQTDKDYIIFNAAVTQGALGGTTAPTFPTTGTWIKNDNATDDLEIKVKTGGKLIIRLGD